MDDLPCNCSNKVSIEYLSEGRYRLGDKTIFIRMLHGKHVMVRVGGGWDTLRGFLTKYDPLRVLQFTTLEQKILAFQKGPPGLGGHHTNTAPPPPDMDPLAAVDDLVSSSASSSSCSSSGLACKPTSVIPAGQTCRSYNPSPACTPTLPRKGSVAVQRKNLQTAPSSPRKPTQLPLPIATKGSSSLPSTPVSSSCRQPPSLGCQGGQGQRRAMTPSASPVGLSPVSNLKPRPHGPTSHPRSPVCPEPSSKCPKPSSPCTSPTAAHMSRPNAVSAPRDVRPPSGANQRSRLAQRRPGSPASRLRLETVRRARTAARTLPLRRTVVPESPAPCSQAASRTPSPSTRTASPAPVTPTCSMSKVKDIKNKVTVQNKVTAAIPGQVPVGSAGSSSSKGNQKAPPTAQRMGRKPTAIVNPSSKMTLKPEPKTTQTTTSQRKPPKAAEIKSSFAKKIPQSKVRSEEPYFEMSSKRKQKA
ncbi:hypothetical protein CHARACLAT_005865 [Characodon lateralis]|uniref:GAR domain-containing protein n=1 Tax=Characodon lateralis TaxID=208331 RepID=A0ABU7E965_9TELE|nr:hypothetical protein [Characodon lateralis]